MHHVGLKITRNTLEPGLRSRVRQLQNPRPVLEAMGTALVSYSKRSFNQASLRAAPWPNKKDGSPATLKRKGSLWQSIRIGAITKTTVTVSSDRPYAPVHQLGAKDGKIPSRPFLPVIAGKLTEPAQRSVNAAASAKLKKLI